MQKEAQKKKQFNNKKMKLILTVVITAVFLLLIVFIGAQRIGNVTLINMKNNVRAYFMSLGSGDGFPYTFEDVRVKGIKKNNSNLFLLTDKDSRIISPTAKEIAKKKHTYSEPAIKTKGSKFIIYDLSSGRFRVGSGTEVIKEHNLDKRIMAASVGKKGNYAVASYGDGVQSVLREYSKSDKEEFIWNFRDERVVDISLSDDGKYAAAATVSSKDGDLNSKLYVFDFDSEKYVSCFEYPGTFLMKVDYVRNRDIAVLGNNLRSFITDNTARHKDEKFTSDKVQNCCVTDKGRSALVLSKYGSTALSELTVYSSKNEKQFSVTFDKQVKWVDCDEKYTAVLFENEVKTFNRKGEQTGSIIFDGEPLKVVVDSGKTYVLTYVDIQCYDTRGDNRSEKSEKVNK